MQGSFQNRMAERSAQPEPEIGMGATILLYTDRHAATVVEVRHARTGPAIRVVRDKVTRTDTNGMSDAQSYSYAPGEGSGEWFSKRGNGRWVRVGESMRNGTTLALGYRDEHYDFGF